MTRVQIANHKNVGRSRAHRRSWRRGLRASRGATRDALDVERSPSSFAESTSDLRQLPPPEAGITPRLTGRLVRRQSVAAGQRFGCCAMTGSSSGASPDVRIRGDRDGRSCAGIAIRTPREQHAVVRGRGYRRCRLCMVRHLRLEPLSQRWTSTNSRLAGRLVRARRCCL